MKRKYEFGITMHRFFLKLAEEKPFEYDFAYDTNGIVIKNISIIILEP